MSKRLLLDPTRMDAPCPASPEEGVMGYGRDTRPDCLNYNILDRAFHGSW